MFKEHLANRVYRRLFYSIMTVGGITALVKLAAAGRDLALARQFGTRGEFDAYLIAYAVPSFATNLVAGSIAAALIPIFIEVRTGQGRDAAQRLLSSTLFSAAVLLSAISILLASSFHRLLPLVASGFPPAQAALTEALFWVLLPGLLLGGMSLTCGAVLNASGCFVRVAAAPFLTPCVQLLFVLTAHGSRIRALAFGTLAGSAIEMGILVWALHSEGYAFTPRWRGLVGNGNVLGRQYLAMTIGGVLMGSTVIVDQSMAAMLGPGSVSALAYGTKLGAVLREVGPTAMSTVLLPHFATLVANRQWDGLRRDLGVYTRLILVVSVPATVLLALFSRPIVAVLFQRGAFTAADTATVSLVQSLFVLQIPFYMLGIMLVRVVSAFKANQILMYGTAISTVVNVAFNYWLMSFLGVAGIALSTSVVYVVAFLFLSIMVSRLMKTRTQAAPAMISPVAAAPGI